jgi:CheY-like chemotaxis protein
MPRMNGIEFLAELRADPDLKKIPVVVLTTSNAEQDRIDAYNSNVAGYILKPIAFTVFVEQMIVLNNYWLSCEMP